MVTTRPGFFTHQTGSSTGVRAFPGNFCTPALIQSRGWESQLSAPVHTRGVELVLDREAATELIRMLIPVVGRTEIGLMIDSP